MSSKVNGKAIDFFIEGPISEKTSIFETYLQNFENIKINLSKTTFINSIGVRNWINWIHKSPPNAKISMEECPYVIINQVNIVDGFIPAQTIIESFHAPYICESCMFEKTIKLIKDEHYKYKTEQSDSSFDLPKNIQCQKCPSEMEPDFIEEKVFKFLKTKI